MKEHITREFIVTQDQDSEKVEIWVDWIASVDSNPHSPVQARLDGEDLLIIPVPGKDKDKKTRRIVGLENEVIQELGQGIVLRLCASSGVLAQHNLTLQN